MVFDRTLYREPTEEELSAFEDHPSISKEDVLSNFHYISVGKGIFTKDKKDQIVSWIGKLCRLYPDNNTYKEALELAKTETTR